MKSESKHQAPPVTGPAGSAKTVQTEPQVFLSIVIPVYNEASRIPTTLHRVLEYLERRTESCEVVVVDDGSADDTVALVEKVCQEERSVRLLRNPGNCGKGYAVRNGMLQARGEYLLFSDADLSTPIAELDRLLEPLQSGYDVVIGSRALRPEWVHPRQSPLRVAAGRTFNFCVRGITSLDFRDTQCGFKAFRRQAAQAIFSCQKIPGFSFDVEVLYLARKFGYRALEVPIHWSHDARTKVHPFRDGPRMFLDLLRIRWNDWSGRYNSPA